jgi:hypothetical protein
MILPAPRNENRCDPFIAVRFVGLLQMPSYAARRGAIGLLAIDPDSNSLAGIIELAIPVKLTFIS